MTPARHSLPLLRPLLELFHTMRHTFVQLVQILAQFGHSLTDLWLSATSQWGHLWEVVVSWQLLPGEHRRVVLQVNFTLCACSAAFTCQPTLQNVLWKREDVPELLLGACAQFTYTLLSLPHLVTGGTAPAGTRTSSATASRFNASSAASPMLLMHEV